MSDRSWTSSKTVLANIDENSLPFSLSSPVLAGCCSNFEPLYSEFRCGTHGRVALAFQCGRISHEQNVFPGSSGRRHLRYPATHTPCGGSLLGRLDCRCPGRRSPGLRRMAVLSRKTAPETAI